MSIQMAQYDLCKQHRLPHQRDSIRLKTKKQNLVRQIFYHLLHQTEKFRCHLFSDETFNVSIWECFLQFIRIGRILCIAIKCNDTPVVCGDFSQSCSVCQTSSNLIAKFVFGWCGQANVGNMYWYSII